MNKNHKKKMIPPIIISAILIIYYAIYFGFIAWLLMPYFWKFFFGILPAFFAAMTIKVLIERIKEIKEGEEDDLSKY